jgi:uncharacterized protein (UPF0335 family)
MTDARLLKSYVERIERLEEEQAAIGGDKRDIFKEAKGKGFNTKVLRRLIRERKRDAAETQAEEAELETYRAALGMGVALVQSGLSLRDAAKKAGVSKSSIHRALAVPAVSHDTETGEVIESSGGDGEKARTPTPLAGGDDCLGATQAVPATPSLEPGPLDDPWAAVDREREKFEAMRAARLKRDAA